MQGHWMMAESMINCSNGIYSLIRRILSSSINYFVICYFYREIFNTTKFLNHVSPSVKFVMQK